MTNYTEIIERLRFYSRQGTRYGMAVITMDAAANAIEELLSMVNDLEMERRMLQLEVYKEGLLPGEV